jgi:hypothetical protein
MEKKAPFYLREWSLGCRTKQKKIVRVIKENLQPYFYFLPLVSMFYFPFPVFYYDLRTSKGSQNTKFPIYFVITDYRSRHNSYKFCSQIFKTVSSLFLFSSILNYVSILKILVLLFITSSISNDINIILIQI